MLCLFQCVLDLTLTKQLNIMLSNNLHKINLLLTFRIVNVIIITSYKECVRDKLDDRTATCLGKVLKLDRWEWILNLSVSSVTMGLFYFIGNCVAFPMKQNTTWGCAARGREIWTAFPLARERVASDSLFIWIYR